MISEVPLDQEYSIALQWGDKKITRYSRLSLPIFQIESGFSSSLYHNQNTWQICIPVR